jgi:DNA (cytosine-5)-methyltransferase 1
MKPLATSSQPRITAIDLFCGAGGFSLGLEKAGIEVLAAFDCWGKALETYKENFSHPAFNMDLSKVSSKDVLDSVHKTPGEIDILVGGPPCQGFSIQRIGDDSDERNNLILKFGKLVRGIKPQLFLMENVPGLLGKRGKELFNLLLSDLSSEGYNLHYKTINAADYGAPQIRRRVVLAGWISNENPFELPPPTHPGENNYISVSEALGDLPSPPVKIDSSGDRLHRRTKLSPLNLKRMEAIPPGGGMMDLPDELKVNCHKSGAAKIGHRYVYGRLHPNEPAPTITARFDSFTRGKFGHYSEARNITLREGARLQTFPDDFTFIGNQEQVAAQIGNAVPFKVALALSFAAKNFIMSKKLAANN